MHCLRLGITLLILSYLTHKHREVKYSNRDTAEKLSESGSTGSNLTGDRNRKYLQEERQQVVKERTRLWPQGKMAAGNQLDHSFSNLFKVFSPFFSSPFAPPLTTLFAFHHCGTHIFAHKSELYVVLIMILLSLSNASLFGSNLSVLSSSLRIFSSAICLFAVMLCQIPNAEGM